MQWCVFMTFPEYGPATECCITESISSTGIQNGGPKKVKALYLNGHFRGNIVYITIPVTNYTEA